MLLQACNRLKVYYVIVLLTLIMMIFDLPEFGTGTCMGILVFASLGLWLELGDYITDENES